MIEQHDEAIDTSEDWLRYAEQDFVAAERLLEPPALPGTVCFHAQQAAEKALKAYLIWLTADRVPHTHDLRTLSAAVVERGGQAPDEGHIEALGGYAVAARYPGSPQPNETHACEAIEAARELLAFVRCRVGLHGDQDQRRPDEPD